MQLACKVLLADELLLVFSKTLFKSLIYTTIHGRDFFAAKHSPVEAYLLHTIIDYGLPVSALYVHDKSFRVGLVLLFALGFSYRRHDLDWSALLWISVDWIIVVILSFPLGRYPGKYL